MFLKKISIELFKKSRIRIEALSRLKTVKYNRVVFSERRKVAYARHVYLRPTYSKKIRERVNTHWVNKHRFNKNFMKPFPEMSTNLSTHGVKWNILCRGSWMYKKNFYVQKGILKFPTLHKYIGTPSAQTFKAPAVALTRDAGFVDPLGSHYKSLRNLLKQSRGSIGAKLTSKHDVLELVRNSEDLTHRKLVSSRGDAKSLSTGYIQSDARRDRDYRLTS